MFLNTLKHIFGRATIIGINQAAVLISLPILASRLDFYTFGQVAIGFLLVQLSWLISDWGIQNYSIEVWRNLNDNLKKAKFISYAIMLNLFIAIIFLILILLLIQLGILSLPFYYWLCIIPSILMGSVYPLWFFQVQKSPQDMILPTFISRLIFLGMVFILVESNETASWAFLAQGVNLSLITIYAFFCLYTNYSFNWQKFNFREIILLARSSFPFLMNSITNNQINTIWGFGLSVTSGPYAMALFNLGDQLYRAGGAISNIIAQSVRIHFIGNSFYDSRFTILFFVGLYSLIAVSISWSAHFLIDNFFPQEYLPATQIIQVMMIAWGLHAIVKLLNYPVLGEQFGPAWVNLITYKILFIHILLFAIWYYFYTSVLAMAILFTSVILIQLIIFLIHIFRASKVK